MRRWILLAALWLSAVTPACAVQPAPPQRILFVGNSLTYYGNLPATFAALAQANGHAIEAEMILEGGATLSERLADGSVQTALAGRRPQVLVLQERGGDLLCLGGRQRCEQSQHALQVLAEAARTVQARVLVLGTYQANAQASAALVEKEAAAARQAGAEYVEISQTLADLSQHLPDLPWYAEDGMHPGPALTLLDAIKLHHALYGMPEARTLEIDAPRYGANSGLQAVLRRADAAAPNAGTPPHIHYEHAQVERLVRALDRAARATGPAPATSSSAH